MPLPIAGPLSEQTEAFQRGYALSCVELALGYIRSLDLERAEDNLLDALREVGNGRQRAMYAEVEG